MKSLPDEMRKCLPYNERLKNYEREKQALLSTMAHLPAGEFSERLRELQRKWDI